MDNCMASQLERLTSSLVDELRLVLAHNLTKGTASALFVPRKATKNAAIFHEDISDLIPDERLGQKSDTWVVPEGGKAYLRLYPIESVPPMETELDAFDAASRGGLRPMGLVSGWSPARNAFGALVYEAPQGGKLYHFTQLFLSREIWSVDACILNSDYLRERQRSGGFSAPRDFIASGYIETHFVEVLENFLSVAKSSLNLRLPLRVEAGLVGIKGYAITVSPSDLAGSALRDAVQWRGEITSEKPAWEILHPFFDQIWAACGIRRTAARQAELVKGFEQRR